MTGGLDVAYRFCQASWAFFGIELLDVGGWLANCEEALETGADFLAVG